jgi:hypothetical protein
MVRASVRVVRAKDGSEGVLLSLEEFQALLDAATAAKHGVPETKQVIGELRAALQAETAYVDAADFLEQYDAAHGPR